MISEACVDQVLSHRRDFHWRKQFREGHTSSVAVKQSGGPVSIFTDVISDVDFSKFFDRF